MDKVTQYLEKYQGQPLSPGLIKTISNKFVTKEEYDMSEHARHTLQSDMSEAQRNLAEKDREICELLDKIDELQCEALCEQDKVAKHDDFVSDLVQHGKERDEELRHNKDELMTISGEYEACQSNLKKSEKKSAELRDQLDEAEQELGKCKKILGLKPDASLDDVAAKIKSIQKKDHELMNYKVQAKKALKKVDELYEQIKKEKQNYRKLNQHFRDLDLKRRRAEGFKRQCDLQREGEAQLERRKREKSQGKMPCGTEMNIMKTTAHK